LKEKTVSAVSILFLLIYGLGAFFMAWNGTSMFLLAFYPLLMILVGVAFLRQSGLMMAFIGLVFTIILAVLQFDTPIEVALGSTAYGFVNSFGISISVSATMLLIFLMKEAGALETISKVIKQQVAGDEMRALYIGIGFGSFLSSLGVVTPALFPPLLVAMGFSPMSSVAIAVLGYDPTTSFSLLSIPITLPAEASKTLIFPFVITPVAMAFKISIFLPVVSTGFAFAILWLVGGRTSMRRGAVPATICGLTLAFACLGTVSLDYFTGVEYVPLRIVGVVAGLCAMMALHVYQKTRPAAVKKEKPSDYPTAKTILRSFSPWIILTSLAAAVSVPQVGTFLQNLPGNFEKIVIFADQTIDLNVFSQIYTWIFIAVLLSLFTLRLTVKQAKKAASVWMKHFIGPFLAYSLYFCIAYVMANSAKTIIDGKLISQPYNSLNMNVVLGSTLAAIFGSGYVFVAASLGLFGAVVGGSETSSNILFLKIQRTAAQNTGLTDAEFMTVYGSHAVAGGIASAITPAKINNAVVTIDEPRDTESRIMQKHLVIAILLTVTTGILTGVFVKLGI
jgi:lactate permease